MSHRGPVRNHLKAAIVAAGARGMTQGEMVTPDIDYWKVSVTVSHMVTAGEIIRVGPKMLSRYFASREHAAAAEIWMVAELAEHTARLKAIRSAKQIAVQRERRARERAAKPPKPEKVKPVKRIVLLSALKPSAKHQPATVAQIVVPANVKRTVHPTPPARFEVTGPVIGGFATAGIGRYLEAA